MCIISVSKDLSKIVGIINKMLQHFGFVADFSKICHNMTISIGELWGIPERMNQRKKWHFLFFYCIFECFGKRRVLHKQKEKVCLGIRFFAPKWGTLRIFPIHQQMLFALWCLVQFSFVAKNDHSNRAKHQVGWSGILQRPLKTSFFLCIIILLRFDQLLDQHATEHFCWMMTDPIR